MKAYFSNLTPRGWFLLALPVVAIGYPIASLVVPLVMKAVIPEVVRTVLGLM
jgi:hypothetical protein